MQGGRSGVVAIHLLFLLCLGPCGTTGGDEEGHGRSKQNAMPLTNQVLCNSIIG